MNIRVRQVPSWMDCSASSATSPVAFAAMLHSSGTAGTAVRLATAKAPDGAGSVAATGHVVAPALSCDGPGIISLRGWPETLPDSDTNRWYPALRASGSRRAGQQRDCPPARSPDRPRGDRPRQAASRCMMGARSGFGRAVSLSSEPAPQYPSASPTSSGPSFARALATIRRFGAEAAAQNATARNSGRFVAMAQP
ncbi:hypothetical protein EDF57_103303 [Novosphingobium sp. PhB55]|nr:hypothetical protein EDF57_103303 [Novosphingobium sp. PhB55]